MSKLLIVSNRLPVTIGREDGRLVARTSVGGLATGLGSFYQSLNSEWVGWPGIATDELTPQDRQEITTQLGRQDCHPVFLSQEEIEAYYNGFCNKTLWPLFHYFPLYTQYEKAFWEAYRAVNQRFCDAVVNLVEAKDTIWIQDYQLLLLPGLIRERHPDATIGFFLHIPFPSSELFRLLPWRREILEALLGADLIGFHTYDYVRHFLTTVQRLLGYGQSAVGRLRLLVDDRVIRTEAFPMGIDYEHYQKGTTQPDVQKEVERIRCETGNRKIILSLDRLDYSKGLIQRLQAYDRFLEEYPEYKGKVTLVLKAIASRSGISQYQLLKKQLDELVGRVNGRHGTLNWMPVWYLFRFLPAATLSALYAVADVALLTPVRDGMNLIAKEYLASKQDGKGVLILSELAGAAQELPEALIVNPNNQEEIVSTLKEALTMSEEEQITRNRVMQERLQRYNVVRWAEDFLDRLQGIKRVQQELAAKTLTVRLQEELVKAYCKSERRLLLFDYDGTLVPFADNPKDAAPDGPLLALLDDLAQQSGNMVVIISGRDRKTLANWFSSLNLALVAEHGAWIREQNGEWETIEPLTSDWKEEVRSLLERYVDRTPGSFLEEKEFSLVWHYRKADEAFAEVRIGELKEDLDSILAHRPLGVLEGNRVLEIKNAGINKGRVVYHWIPQEKWDFLLAIGDDATDEDTFRALPKEAYSIKVGLEPSHARFNLASPISVRRLLDALISQGESLR